MKDGKMKSILGQWYVFKMENGKMKSFLANDICDEIYFGPMIYVFKIESCKMTRWIDIYIHLLIWIWYQKDSYLIKDPCWI